MGSLLTEETHCANPTFTFVLVLARIFLFCSVLFLLLFPCSLSSMGWNQEERARGGLFLSSVFEFLKAKCGCSLQCSGSSVWATQLNSSTALLAYGHSLEFTLVCTFLADWIVTLPEIRDVKQQGAWMILFYNSSGIPVGTTPLPTLGKEQREI